MIEGDRAESNRRQTDSQSASGNQHRTRPQRKERGSNPQGIFKMLDRLPTGSRLQSGGPSNSLFSTVTISVRLHHDSSSLYHCRFAHGPRVRSSAWWCHPINVKDCLPMDGENRQSRFGAKNLASMICRSPRPAFSCRKQKVELIMSITFGNSIRNNFQTISMLIQSRCEGTSYTVQ